MHASNCYMNPVSRVSSFRSHELVEVLFLKRDGYDWRVYLPELSSRRFFESGAYQIIFGEGAALIPERRLFDSGV